ncbi:MAG: ChaN family lipoprotein [Thermodesulfobacteriota bacterium]|nr:ChaN family lipoprotein [Thermodesulfobacteriota bacterium]
MSKQKTIVLVITLLTVMCAVGVTASLRVENPQLYDLSENRSISLKQLAVELKTKRIVLVGEHHNNIRHHINQLEVIRALHEAGAKVAVGMEMFRSDSQKYLGQWVAGKIPEKEFEKIYYANWNYNWSLYRPILQYARENRIPVLGLNVSRKITRQVARQGFQSLNKEQRGKLKDVACRVDKVYMDFIKRAYGAHAHGNLNFEYFCESQLVWDNIMAINSLDYIRNNPDSTVVLIAGNGHVWKGGIPTQLNNRSFTAYAVILPEIPGVVEKNTISLRDTDYIFLE